MKKFLLIIPLLIIILGVVVILHRGTGTNSGGLKNLIVPQNNTSSTPTATTPSVTAINLPQISVSGNHLVDPENKQIILRGFVTIVNIYAYNDNSFQDYSPSDYKVMRLYGANYQSIRLGGKAIGAGGGSADSSYLQKTDQMVADGANEGIYSEFKLTVFDMNGFLGASKNKSWGNFWRNKNGEQETFINGWKNVWLRYKDSTSVVGYDLLNEPSQGDLGVSDTEFVNSYLGPFYQKAIDALRTIDTTHLAYFQPGLKGFDDIPFRFVINRPNIVYAPHFYPGVKTYLQDLYGSGITTSLTSSYQPLISQFLADASTNKAPIVIGEYGMPWDPKFDGDSSKTAVYTSLESTAMDLFAQNNISYSRPWYSDDKAGVKLSNVDLNWGLIKGTGGLKGTPRSFIFDVFKAHALK